MEAKCFFNVFNILYVNLHEQLNISTKEDFYRCMFAENYASVSAGTDADGIRKITSGLSTILQYVMKQLHTVTGFEVLRTSIEGNIITPIKDGGIVTELLNACETNDYIPENIKLQLREAVTYCDDSYGLSRFIAAVLICANYADYITVHKEKGKDKPFIDISFMRLAESKPIPQYPRFITDSMDAAVDELLGRNNDLKRLYQDLIMENKKTMISAVGGLGKTELVKVFLDQLRATPVEECGIEQIAWIPYDNNDICLSLKQSLHLECSADEVWGKVQDLTESGRERLLMVIDNIETIDNDPYLKKLSELPCRVLVTSRVRALYGFKNLLFLQPLEMEYCRELFYRHYQFDDRDNEILNDIIDLTAKLTIMIVFIAKAAYLEGLSLREVYDNLVEKGFKLSEEDVSCEHEKMQNHDKTIIEQMCILFSLVKYDETDKQTLTCISIIPNLQFDFPKAKRWFSIKKNAHLMRLYGMGMLEHVTSNRSHIYWMHSVIAAAVREQQKEKLYHLSRPFIQILDEELDTEDAPGKTYEKAYLIPFSWSAADIMQDHWSSEDDIDFLSKLFHVCFSCSNYKLCEKINDMIIEIKENPDNSFSVVSIVNAYRDKIDLLNQFDRVSESEKLLQYAEELLDEQGVPQDERDFLSYEYAIVNQVKGNYEESRKFFQKIIDLELERTDDDNNRDLATAYTNMGRMLTDSGDFEEAYDYLKKAIQIQGEQEDDADLMISYANLAGVGTELMNAGFGTTYVEETYAAFQKVIKFREKYLGQKHADTAVIYHDFSYFWYVCGVADKALEYNEKAYKIEERLYADHSITRLRSLNTKALILSESDHLEEALEIYDDVISTAEEMNSDYLVDMADFQYNYAECLAQKGYFDEAKVQYKKCIDIWTELSEEGNRKLALAYQRYADILLMEKNFEKALKNYKQSDKCITEDFYLKVEVIDSIACCYILLKNIDMASDTFVELLRYLDKYNAYDSETKFTLCDSLAAVMNPQDEDECKCKNQIIDKILNDKSLSEYVNTFFTKVDEK